MRFFDRLHPAVSFLYFVLILFITMFTLHPVLLGILFLTGIFFYAQLKGLCALLKSFLYTLPLMLVITLMNPLFVHRGNTVLFFLNGSPVTKEAMIYGFFTSLMLLAIFYFCQAYSAVMTSDKFIYLFGRVIPKLSLVFSMTLAALPRLLRKYREIDEAQKGLGIYATNSWVDKVKSKLRVFSILVSWSLEASVETADSMRARGYGLKGRTAYSDYRFTSSDTVFLLLTLLLGGTVAVLLFMGVSDFSYYPTVDALRLSPLSLLLYGTLALLASLSILSEGKETLLWHYWESKI